MMTMVDFLDIDFLDEMTPDVRRNEVDAKGLQRITLAQVRHQREEGIPRVGGEQQLIDARDFFEREPPHARCKDVAQYSVTLKAVSVEENES